MIHDYDESAAKIRAGMEAITAQMVEIVSQFGVTMQQAADTFTEILSLPDMGALYDELERLHRLRFPGKYMDWRDTPLTGLPGKLEAWGRRQRAEMGGE